MKKTQTVNNKSGHFRKSNQAQVCLSPKKEFQLLYRERDPQHTEEAYENIIFMKSKKCERKPKRKSQGRIKAEPVEQLAQMVAQIEKQFKNQKQRSSRKPNQMSRQNILKTPAHPKVIFRNKQINQTLHSKASSRWTKYKKQQGLVQTTKKYKNMLSPSRRGKQTQTSKFLKSTQQTFRKQIKNKEKKKDKAENIQPQEYIFLQNNFISLSHEDVNLLELKITSAKTMNSKKYVEIINCSEMQEKSQEESWNSHLNGNHSQSKRSQNESITFFQKNVEFINNYLIQKAKIIQRWWRKILENKKNKFDPIIFQSQKNQENLDESMLFIRNKLVKDLQSSEVSPIKMVQTYGSNKETIPDKFIQDRPDPFDLRQNAAQHQLKTHLQMLNQLLKGNKITANIYFQKKSLIQAKYRSQLQSIEQLRKIMAQNTQRAYFIAKKTEEDRSKLENFYTNVDEQVLDQIFGKDFYHIEPVSKLKDYKKLPQNYQITVFNRQKSTGCHFDGQQKTSKPSIYEKKSGDDQQYQQDFQDQQSQDNPQIAETANPQGNQNGINAFSQLLDEYKLRHEVKIEIDKRTALQMGAIIQQIPEEVKNQKIGIDTSLTIIHRFMLSFFKFYIFYYRDEFLKLINMPFGLNIERRLKILQGNDDDLECPQEDQAGVIYGLESVISDQILDDFYEKIYDSNTLVPKARRANYEFEKIHNRAVLDCFNEALNCFRPYFSINGSPFPWSISQKALTFYFIAQQNIQEVFEKTQFKVLKWGSTLCGIHVDKFTQSCNLPNKNSSIEQLLEIYKSYNHPDVNQAREDRQMKDEKVEIIQNSHLWGNLEDQYTMIQIQNSNFIFDNLVKQIVEEITFGLKNHFQRIIDRNFDFFQGLSEEDE